MRGFPIFALFLLACSVDLAEPARDDGGSGSGNGGGGGISNEGGSGGTPAGGFGGFAGSGAGGSGGGGLGGGGGSGGSTDPCTACIEQKCPVSAQCDAYPACGVMSSCYASCTTPECQVDCHDADQTARDLYFGTISCVYLSCPSECVYATNPDCFQCENTNCKPQRDACVSSKFCITYWYCVDLCVDAPCFDLCDYYWGFAGAPLYDAYGTCSYSNCGGVCA